MRTISRRTLMQIIGAGAGALGNALILDPDNIEALVGTAHVDAGMTTSFMTDDPVTRFASAEAALTKALSVAPNNAGPIY
jgi:cytochrome c-type biogenesis protein CcmH/NrfG